MKILYLSNFVDADNILKYSFLQSRIKALKQLGVDVEAVQMGRHSSKYINKAIRLLYSLFMRLFRIDGFISTDTYVFDDSSFVLHKIEIFEYKPSKVQKVKERLFAQLVAEKAPNLIHVHFLWHAELAYQFHKTTGFPYVVTAHGSDVHQVMKNDKEKQALFLEILSHSSQNIFVSNALKQQAVELGMHPENSLVIHNGVNKDIFYNQHKPRKNVVGFVGHLFKVKGADRLPQIFRLIADKIDDIQFLIVGAGSEYENLQSHIENRLKQYAIRDKVTFTGKVSQTKLNNFYNQMRILLVPSRNEGFSCVIKESQAAGVYVVGNHVGGIPEAIGNRGEVIDNNEDFEKDAANVIVQNLQIESDINDNALISSWTDIVKQEITVYNNISL